MFFLSADVEIGDNNEFCDHKKQLEKGALHKSKVEANGQLSSAAGVHELQRLNNSVTVTAATPT